MAMRMATVAAHQKVKRAKMTGPPAHPLIPRPILMTMFHSTSDSSEGTAKRKNSYVVTNSSNASKHRPELTVNSQDLDSEI